MLISECFLVDGLANVVEFVEDKPTTPTDIEQLCVLIVAVVDGLAYLQDEVFVSHL